MITYRTTVTRADGHECAVIADIHLDKHGATVDNFRMENDAPWDCKPGDVLLIHGVVPGPPTIARLPLA